MPAKFLSPAWFDAVRSIRARHADVHGAAGSYRTNHTVTNVPEYGTVEFHLDLGDDVFYEPGHVEDADLSVTYDYDTARAIYLDRSIRLEELRDADIDGRVTFVGDPVVMRDYWTEVVGHAGHLGMFDEIAAATE